VQLSLHGEYALRVLLYLGSHPDRVVSTAEISGAYGISKNHLVRVMQSLPPDGVDGRWVPESQVTTLPLTGLARKILCAAKII